MEGIEAGNAMLVGTSGEKISSAVKLLLDDTDEYNKMSHAGNPYGDGKASERIFSIVSSVFNIPAKTEIHSEV
jgi:UDP-N-acetylglucosamine 2-epimerase (non-hydrolysing)